MPAPASARIPVSSHWPAEQPRRSSIPTIDRDDARRLLWHFGDRSETNRQPDAFQEAIFEALIAGRPQERARLAQLYPSPAAAVDLATGYDDGLDRLRAVIVEPTGHNAMKPTATERALATLHSHLSRFQVLKMTPEERTAYGDAVDKVFRYDDPEDFEPITRWWHEDYVPGT